jgi:hypothetical protein
MALCHIGTHYDAIFKCQQEVDLPRSCSEISEIKQASAKLSCGVTFPEDGTATRSSFLKKVPHYPALTVNRVNCCYVGGYVKYFANQSYLRPRVCLTMSQLQEAVCLVLSLADIFLSLAEWTGGELVQTLNRAVVTGV